MDLKLVLRDHLRGRDGWIFSVSDRVHKCVECGVFFPLVRSNRGISFASNTFATRILRRLGDKP